MQQQTDRARIIILVSIIILSVLVSIRVSRHDSSLKEVLGNRNEKASVNNTVVSNSVSNTTTNTSTNTTTTNNSTQNTPSSALATGDYSFTMTSGGIERSYKLHVPRKTNGTTPLPLVLALHGGGNDGDSQENVSHMNIISNRETFLVAYPDGINKNWNDGRADIASKTNNADDVTFLVSLVSEIGKKTPVDTKKVYATGISNGGMMSYRLACEKPEIFSAIAPVSSALTPDLQKICNPSQSISIMIIQGVDDPIVPYVGGDIKLLGGRVAGPFTERGSVLSAVDGLNFWKTKNGCVNDPAKSTLPNTSTTDGTTTDKEIYSCSNGAEIHFLKVNGGGHTWPGGIQYLAERFIGKTSRDFDAGQVMWDFFNNHSR